MRQPNRSWTGRQGTLSHSWRSGGINTHKPPTNPPPKQNEDLLLHFLPPQQPSAEGKRPIQPLHKEAGVPSPSAIAKTAHPKANPSRQPPPHQWETPDEILPHQHTSHRLEEVKEVALPPVPLGDGEVNPSIEMIQVGGRLHHFAKRWEFSPWAHSIVSKGLGWE